MVRDHRRRERHLVGVGIHVGYGDRWGLGEVTGASGTHKAGEMLSVGNNRRLTYAEQSHRSYSEPCEQPILPKVLKRSKFK